MRPSPWRVRVRRSMEVWVDVTATSAVDAEKQAATVPGVLMVFSQSARRADEASIPERTAGVRDE